MVSTTPTISLLGSGMVEATECKDVSGLWVPSSFYQFISSSVSEFLDLREHSVESLYGRSALGSPVDTTDKKGKFVPSKKRTLPLPG